MQSVETETVGAVKQNRYINKCRGWSLKHSGPWSSLCSHGYYVFTLVVWYISLVVKPGIIKFGLLSQISTWRSRSKIRILTKVFCTSDPNLVILAWTGDEFWHGQTQGSHTYTDTHMDRQMQAMTITKGQIWPGLGSIHFFQFNSILIQVRFWIFQFNSIPIQIGFRIFQFNSNSIHFLSIPIQFNSNFMHHNKLEIVDQWSTRIPPPHRRGWQWAMGGLQLNIVQNHKAAILKAT